MNREVQILQGLSNPRIVNLHAVHRTKQWVFLVMELVRGGELFDVIVSNKTAFRNLSNSLFKPF